jgi:hypothetical protein
VNPAAIRTREDVVRAFEYLALLRLGPGARPRHHRDLALKLGGSEAVALAPPDRRRAALELAELYERARYTPPQDPWPESAVTAARRNLCSLAGVAPA